MASIIPYLGNPWVNSKVNGGGRTYKIAKRGTILVRRSYAHPIIKAAHPGEGNLRDEKKRAEYPPNTLYPMKEAMSLSMLLEPTPLPRYS